MAEYLEGISEEELFYEIAEKVLEGNKFTESYMIYSDVSYYLGTIMESKGKTSEQQIKIITENYKESCKKQLEMFHHYETLKSWVDFYRKKFPESKLLKDSGIEQKLEESLKLCKEAESGFVDIISRLFNLSAERINTLFKIRKF